MPEIRPPGDKSISHRALLLAPLALGTSRLVGLQAGEDVRATARALRALGAEVPDPGEREVEIPGPAAWRSADEILACANSSWA
jgi:3-phosphoshikimate 1-carboxyvinyltransferase